MWHTLFVTGHAIAGVIAFVAGCLALRWTAVLTVYLAALVALFAFVVPALLTDWASLEAGARAGFTAVAGLAGYLVWRGTCAWRSVRPAGGDDPTRYVDSTRYVDHIGFTLIALLDGFLIVAVLDTGGPGWLAAVAGVLGVLAGHLAIERIKRRTGRAVA